MTDGPWLIVGLGNPGPTYEGHRHNVGYLVLDELARRMGGRLSKDKSGRADSLEGRLRIGGPRVILGRPRSFMNETGGPTKALATFHKISPDQLIVIHDELDIPFDSLRLKFGGGDNGHNGLKSIRSALGGGDFYRVRVGIGRPSGRQDVADFVLSNFSAAERKVVAFQVDAAADAIEALVEEGLEKAQQRFNS